MNQNLAGGSWDGAGYSPTSQTSLYPFTDAGFQIGCCAGDRTVVASSIMNSGDEDLFFQLRSVNADGELIFSQHLPANTTTSFQFPVKLPGKPYVLISTTPYGNDPYGTPGELGGIFFVR